MSKTLASSVDYRCASPNSKVSTALSSRRIYLFRALQLLLTGEVGEVDEVGEAGEAGEVDEAYLA